ncbi:MAG: hypothetical protein K9L88_18615 [Chromatiaceae bacterium]|nr:hypothetical protein [Chromatiaceae bacterium]
MTTLTLGHIDGLENARDSLEAMALFIAESRWEVSAGTAAILAHVAADLDRIANEAHAALQAARVASD